MPHEFFINISLCSPAGHVDQLVLISFSKEAAFSPSHHFSLLQLPTVSNYSLDLNKRNNSEAIAANLFLSNEAMIIIYIIYIIKVFIYICVLLWSIEFCVSEGYSKHHYQQQQ